MKKIKTIFFSGGGLRGISFIGAIKALNEYDMIDNVETYIGTSIGSLFATILALKLPYDYVYSKFINLELDKYIDVDIDHLFSKFGLDTGKKLMAPIIKAFQDHKYSKHITFKQLYDKNKKKLVISATCLTELKVHYFDYVNSPNMSIIKAIRMSISIPFYFTAQKYMGKLYIDGSVFEYFPLNLYPPDEHFLALNTRYKKKCVNLKIESMESYLLHIYYGVKYRIEELEKMICYKYNSINILIENCELLDFSLTKNVKKSIINVGYDTVKDYIVKNNESNESNESDTEVKNE